MLCGDWTLVKQIGEKLYAEPLKCRCWHCDYCRPHRVNQLKALARDGFPDTFLTLTVNPKTGEDANDRARALAQAWRKLRQRAMRRYRYKSLPFLAVFEKTKAGEPHLHILLRVKWLDQKWLSKQMAILIGAPIVDIRRVTGQKGAARYIAKYLGKDPHSFEGCKRYWRSQDWADAAEPDDERLYIPPDAVAIVRVNLASYLKNMKSAGWNVYQEEGGEWCVHNLRTDEMWEKLYRWRRWLRYPEAMT